eukprot:40759_1
MNVNYFSELDGQDLTTLDRKTLYNHLKEARQADKSYQIIPKNIRNAKWNQHPNVLISELRQNILYSSYSKYTDLLDRLRWFGNQHGSQIKKMVSIIKQLHSVGIVMNADIDYMIANNKPSYRLGWGGVFNDDDFAEERQGVHNIVKKMVIKAIKLRKEKDSMNIMSVEDKMKGLENRKNEMEELDYLRQMNELRKEQSLN